MKEIRNKKILGVILIICGIVLFLYFGKSIFNNRKYHITKYLDINIKNCQVDSEKDTHGGFLGDGDYFAKLICTEKEDNEVKSKWIKLPLSVEIEKVLNIIDCHDNGCKTAYDRYNIPNIIDGYYYFYDRHSESSDSKDDKNLNNRSSYNFSVGIYDSSTKTIYFYELDT